MKLLKSIIKLQPITPENNKIKLSLKIYGLGLLVLAIFTIFKMIAAKHGLYENYVHPVGVNLKNADSGFKILYILLLTIILHPFIEELSFRLWLGQNRIRFLLGISFCFVLFGLVLSDFHKRFPISNELSFHLIFFIFGIGLAYILLKLLSKNIKIPSTFFLIIISAILFSLLHLNVVGKQDNILAYLIILIPYFIKGYFYGYINYRLGFRYAFFAHVLHNLTLASMNLMMR